MKYPIYIYIYILSWPAVPTSVINKFVIANVRWRVHAEFELHRRHNERAGARAPGIHSCGYRSREIHACEFADFVIANFASDNVFSHSLNLSKEVVSFTKVIYSAGMCDFTYLQGKYVKCSEIVPQAHTTCRTVYTTSSCSKPVRLAWEQQ